MPHEKSLFQTTGPSWSERASLGVLNAVLAPGGCRRSHLFVNGIHLFGAERALRYFPEHGKIIDFGCGTGRFTKFFALHRRQVLATEITAEMLRRAQKECGDDPCEFCPDRRCRAAFSLRIRRWNLVLRGSSLQSVRA